MQKLLIVLVILGTVFSAMAEQKPRTLSSLLAQTLTEVDDATRSHEWLVNRSRNWIVGSTGMTDQESADLDVVLNRYSTLTLGGPQLPAKVKDYQLLSHLLQRKMTALVVLSALTLTNKNKSALPPHTPSLCDLNFENQSEFAKFLGIDSDDLERILSKTKLESSSPCGHSKLGPSLTFPFGRNLKFVVYEDPSYKIKSWSDIGGQTLIFLNSQQFPTANDVVISYIHELAISLDALLPTSMFASETLEKQFSNLGIALPSKKTLVAYESPEFTEFLAAVRAENYALTATNQEPINFCGLLNQQVLAEVISEYNEAKSPTQAGGAIVHPYDAMASIIAEVQAQVARFEITGTIDLEQPKIPLADVLRNFIAENKVRNNFLCRTFSEPRFVRSGETKGRSGPRGPKVGGGS